MDAPVVEAAVDRARPSVVAIGGCVAAVGCLDAHASLDRPTIVDDCRIRRFRAVTVRVAASRLRSVPAGSPVARVDGAASVVSAVDVCCAAVTSPCVGALVGRHIAPVNRAAVVVIALSIAAAATGQSSVVALVVHTGVGRAGVVVVAMRARCATIGRGNRREDALVVWPTGILRAGVVVVATSRAIATVGDGSIHAKVVRAAVGRAGVVVVALTR